MEKTKFKTQVLRILNKNPLILAAAAAAIFFGVIFSGIKIASCIGGEGDNLNGVGRVEKEYYTVCIDAGHGYDDPGMISPHWDNLTEKEVNLSISLMLKERLEELGYRVVMTRENDNIPEDADKDESYVFTPQDRKDFVDSLTEKPDAFISIHCDYFENDSSITGARIYYSTAKNKSSARLSSKIADGIEATFEYQPIQKSMKLRDAFYVIKAFNIPSVLVEVGFASNKNEAADMADPIWQKSMADAIADGVKSFLPQTARID